MRRATNTTITASEPSRPSPVPMTPGIAITEAVWRASTTAMWALPFMGGAPKKERGQEPGVSCPRVPVRDYLTVAEKRCSTGPIGFENDACDEPAKQRPTGLSPDCVTISEPESPERMNEPGVWIWLTNVAVPFE